MKKPDDTFCSFEVDCNADGTSLPPKFHLFVGGNNIGCSFTRDQVQKLMVSIEVAVKKSMDK